MKYPLPRLAAIASFSFALLLAAAATGRSDGVVKDDAGRAALARAQHADTVAHVDAVDAAGALHRAVMHGDHRGVALAQRQHARTRLHARALLGHHELAAAEVAARLRQQQ